MKTILEQLSDILGKAFSDAGYEESYGKVSFSNRPDLCEFQCNGAMAGAKQYHKAPIMIANEVVGALSGNKAFDEIVAVNPGFINIKFSDEFLCDYLNNAASDDKLGCDLPKKQTVMVDYGGPNVAKPLHVGHLRAAIIGESVKRICRFMGNEVIGDIHLGDWGLQMGLIITELKKRKPELVYFDDGFNGEYPEEAPFTLAELEEIYPFASAKSKEDEDYKKEALDATKLLQSGNPGYRAIWKHIMKISVEDLKKNYENLNVFFDIWKGESDVQDIIPGMVSDMKDAGFAYESDGALVVDVAREDDAKEIPPCIILKSDGASLYTTTDLATLKDRRATYDPKHIIYVVDKRQDMHFVQVFRCAKKTGIVSEDTALDFLGFGTMNGSDGKPFKTREGGVMRLEFLIDDIRKAMFKKIMDNHNEKGDVLDEAQMNEAKNTSEMVALAAIKYGDLSNQATKDYVFDIDKFTSFEGNTGPYILYTMVRIKSILSKYFEACKKGSDLGENCKNILSTKSSIKSAQNEQQKALMLELSKFSGMIASAYNEIAPHKICAYIYDVSNAFNRFYHDTKILTESDEAVKEGWIALLAFTLKTLEVCIDLLGFEAPERM